ncbi:hypothetical protein [Poseidonibacter ostreae]|uniref:Transposase n=1 Tax=Poseidonibacter ostreae TaxID=2654171 RepID=A0ABQ6VLT6_9BACT|nr:hypothetical protein [Poseidonibacter ostreae]KAB7891555.1 hypothetical protein GBG18_06750 [Poseidonibacter ostreae]
MNAKQKEFIILRADGVTFDKIATTLKTSKSTLIKWSRLYQNEINDIQFESMVKIKEEFEYTRKNKYKILLEQLQKVDDAILQKDLKEASLKELFLIKSNIDNQLNRLEDKTILKDSGLQCFNEYTNQNEMIKIKLNDV